MNTLILVIALVVSGLELAGLKRSGNLHDLAVCAIFLGVGIVFWCLHIAGIKLPSPLGIVFFISRPVGEWVSVILS
ncbi:hypothetical protein [Paenibacillus sp. DYY-L-2]|uniref:hypothetical protein n=1 Tax=Paenibacillus sp. DYY-L-2 TaxID=3447013 RepID=UPI003F4FF709